MKCDFECGAKSKLNKNTILTRERLQIYTKPIQKVDLASDSQKKGFCIPCFVEKEETLIV